MISRWEHARTQAGRQWKPTRTYVLHLIHIFAKHLTLTTAQQWAAQAGYLIAAAELTDLFPPGAPFSPVAPSHERQALYYFQAALAQSKETQEPTYVADVLEGCARLFGALGDHQQAEAYSQRAVTLNRQFGRRSGTAEALCTLGWVQNQLGRPEAASAHYHEAIALLQQSNSRNAEGVALLGLRKALTLLGRNAGAMAAYLSSIGNATSAWAAAVRNPQFKRSGRRRLAAR